VANSSAGTKSFLFSDLRGYAAFVERAGDRAAADLLATYRDLVRSVIASYDGAEIKTEGDSFYVVFPSASAAVEAGLAIVAGAGEASTADRPIRIGIGIHAGETVATTEGLVGGAVNIAARVCSKAQTGEVLVTDTVRALTRTFLPYQFTGLGTQQLKGIAGGIPLYRVEAVPSARRARIRRQLAARRGRMLRIAAAGLAVVLLGGGAGFYAANRDPDCVTLSAATRNVVAKIDPTRNCVVATYSVGLRPGPIASSTIGLWVANLGDATVTAIDPVSGPMFTTAVFGSPVAIAAGGGGDAYVLLRDEQTRGLLPDAVTDRVAWVDHAGTVRETRALLKTSARGTARYESIAFSDELAWISDGYAGSVVLVRFRSGLLAPIHVGSEGGLGPIDAGNGAVWIGDALNPVVHRVDGPNAKPLDIRLSDEHGGVTAMDVTESAVWLGRVDRTLSRLDQGTNARQAFPLGVEVKALAAGPDAIWVADNAGAVVLRVDPSTGKAIPIVVGGRPAGIAIATDGSVWVTIQSR
jgi:class 3 adenylate cyclase